MPGITAGKNLSITSNSSHCLCLSFNCIYIIITQLKEKIHNYMSLLPCFVSHTIDSNCTSSIVCSIKFMLKVVFI